jgi:Ca2+-binding RTX toxin-like protein
MRSRALAIGAVLLAIAAGAPAAAQAGTLTKVSEGGGHFHLVFAASPGQNNDLSAGTADATLRFHDSAPITTFPAGCYTAPVAPGVPDAVHCSALDITRLELRMGDGANTVHVNGHVPATITGVGASSNQFLGGQGNDVLVGDFNKDKLDGGFGDDRLIGGGGDDELQGGTGADELRGELGNDSLNGGMDVNGDDLIGGAGADSATYTGRSIGISVSLDGAANDGALGEGDNVGTDIERVHGGSGDDRIVAQAGLVTNALYGYRGNDTLVGGGAGDSLDGGQGSDSISGGAGLDELRGQAGNDSLEGGAAKDGLDGGLDDDLLQGGPGRDQMIGGNGIDRVSYAASPAGVAADPDGEKGDDGAAGEYDGIGEDVEEIVGSPYADVLGGNGADNHIWGGGGNDRIDGRSGKDQMLGEAGNDTMLSADGLADDVQCGDGTDAADSDPIDTLAECESHAPGPVGDPGTDHAASAVRIGPARVRLTRHGIARLRVVCPADAAQGCTGTLRMRRRVAGRLRTVGSHRYAVAAGRRAVVRVRVKRSVRRRIAPTGMRVRVAPDRVIRILPAGRAYAARSGRSG